MDAMLKKLNEYGADVDGAMGRFLDDSTLYKTCFKAFLEDETFEKLGKAIADMDYEQAFEHAHTMKGVTGNMGISPMYKVICNIVEDLRKNEYSSLQDNYAEVVKQLNYLKKLQQFL